MHHTKPRPVLILLFLVLTLFLVGRIWAADLLTPEEIIATYGAPDNIDSTEFDQPRSPLVSKSLTYKREKVQFLFVADAPLGAPPPYKTWGLVGAIDPQKQVSLTVDQVKQRLVKRRRR